MRGVGEGIHGVEEGINRGRNGQGDWQRSYFVSQAQFVKMDAGKLLPAVWLLQIQADPCMG